MSYQTQEAQYEVPGDWDDHSLNIFYLGGGEAKGGSSIVISREPLEGTLAEHVDRQVHRAERALPRFKLVWRRQGKVGPLPSHDVRMRWVRDGMLLDQRQVFVDYFGTLIAYTASAPAAKGDALQGVMDGFLANVKFRRKDQP